MRNKFKLLCTVMLTVVMSGFFGRPATAYKFFTNTQNTPYTWRQRTINWQIQDGAPEIVRESVLYATKTWSDACGGAIAFNEAPGGIAVVWDPSWATIQDSVFLAYTMFTADGDAHIVNATVLINARDYTWHRGGYTGVQYLNGGRDANLDSALVHEFGHALGLDHCNKDLSTIAGLYGDGDYPTMWSVLYAGADTLHLDDETGVRALYPSQPPAPEAALAIDASPQAGRKPLTVFFSTSENDAGTRWDFGDGTPQSGATLQHTFTAPGYYEITASANGQRAKIIVEVDKKNGKKPAVRKPRRVKPKKS